MSSEIENNIINAGEMEIKERREKSIDDKIKEMEENIKKLKKEKEEKRKKRAIAFFKENKISEILDNLSFFEEFKRSMKEPIKKVIKEMKEKNREKGNQDNTIENEGAENR